GDWCGKGGGGSVDFILGYVEVVTALRARLCGRPVGGTAGGAFAQRGAARRTEPGVSIGVGTALTAHRHGETLSSAARFVDRRLRVGQNVTVRAPSSAQRCPPASHCIVGTRAAGSTCSAPWATGSSKRTMTVFSWPRASCT